MIETKETPELTRPPDFRREKGLPGIRTAVTDEMLEHSPSGDRCSWPDGWRLALEEGMDITCAVPGSQPRQSETYMLELDAAVTGGGGAFPMTSREEVIRTAASPSWLRTTWPAACRKMGWMPPCFEGKSITISR